MTDYSSLTNEATFVGLKNYKAVFSDPIFYKALTNTAIFTFGTVPVTTCLALFLAALINSKFARFQKFFRSSLFMPSVTSMVVIALIFSNLYSQDGYINAALQSLHLPFPKRGWLQEPNTALISIMLMDVWSAVGYYMVLCLAGMQTIPQDLYHAADLVGASEWQKFKNITLPMIRPTVVFIVFINTIKSFQIFVEIVVMTKGGPLNATTTLVYSVYNNAFEKVDSMGYASALAYVVFAILLIFSYMQNKIVKN
jgi:multiple sugar transport system permease protein